VLRLEKAVGICGCIFAHVRPGLNSRIIGCGWLGPIGAPMPPVVHWRSIPRAGKPSLIAHGHFTHDVAGAADRESGWAKTQQGARPRKNQAACRYVFRRHLSGLQSAGTRVSVPSPKEGSWREGGTRSCPSRGRRCDSGRGRLAQDPEAFGSAACQPVDKVAAEEANVLAKPTCGPFLCCSVLLVLFCSEEALTPDF